MKPRCENIYAHGAVMCLRMQGMQSHWILRNNAQRSSRRSHPFSHRSWDYSHLISQPTSRRQGSIGWPVSTSVDEARQAEAAGADAILVQGMEAGGHRAYFDPIDANDRLIGLVSLLPAVIDAVKLPVIAAGGISDRPRRRRGIVSGRVCCCYWHRFSAHA